MSAPRTILIVEDNALVAKFFRMSLERAGGYACVVTESVPDMVDRKSTRLNSSHIQKSRMPSSA